VFRLHWSCSRSLRTSSGASTALAENEVIANTTSRGVFARGHIVVGIDDHARSVNLSNSLQDASVLDYWGAEVSLLQFCNGDHNGVTSL
jgi:hypothetical protein